MYSDLIRSSHCARLLQEIFQAFHCSATLEIKTKSDAFLALGPEMPMNATSYTQS